MFPPGSLEVDVGDIVLWLGVRVSYLVSFSSGVLSNSQYLRVSYQILLDIDSVTRKGSPVSRYLVVFLIIPCSRGYNNFSMEVPWYLNR